MNKKPFFTYRLRERLTAILFVSPLFAGFILFTLIPIGVAFFYSLINYNPIRSRIMPPSFEVYGRLLNDTTNTLGFGESVFNTLFLMLSIPLVLAISLSFASMITQKGFKGSVLFRLLFYLPAVTGTVAVIMVWKLMFNETQGIINIFLKKIGLIEHNISWLGEATGIGYPRFTLILFSVWGGIGSTMILYIAGILGIPSTYYEAAEIDGAGKFQQFIKITLPLLTPITFYHLVVSIIGGLQAFVTTQLLADTKGTRTIVYFIYEYGINSSEYGYASAGAFILAVVIMIITILQFRLSKRWVYEG